MQSQAVALASSKTMKRTEKTPSVYVETAHALVQFLTRDDVYDYPLRVESYEIKPIPYPSRQRGREILHIHLAPRFRTPSKVIDDFDPYREEIVRVPNGYEIRSATPQKHSGDTISIYADLADTALSILRDCKGDVIGERWSSWVSLQKHLESKGNDSVWIWNSDNYNDWRVFGPTDELSAFMGACYADIEQSALLLIAHSQLRHGIAAVNRQFQHCPAIYDD